jgi:sugar lactone lactonase YvrE
MIMLFSMIAQAQLRTITSKLDHPESVTSDGKFYYATLIGKELAPTSKDGDGAIVKFDKTGKVLDAHFNKEVLNAPKGTAVVKGTLYVADIDRIVGIDLKSGKQVNVIDLSAFAPQFLNDIAVKGDSVLYISATDQGKIYHVNLTKPTSIHALDIPALAGPNGLLYESKTNTLYVAGLDFTDNPVGELGAITWSGNKPAYKTISDLHGVFDGLQFIDANTLIVSDWISFKVMSARILKVDIKTGKYTEILSGTDAADFYLDPKSHELIIPGLKNGDIFVLPVK